MSGGGKKKEGGITKVFGKWKKVQLDRLGHAGERMRHAIGIGWGLGMARQGVSPVGGECRTSSTRSKAPGRVNGGAYGDLGLR